MQTITEKKQQQKRTITYYIPMLFPLRTCFIVCCIHSFAFIYLSYMAFSLVFCIPFFFLFHCIVFRTPAPILDADRTNELIRYIFVTFSRCGCSKQCAHVCVLNVYCSVTSVVCLCLFVSNACTVLMTRDAVYSEFWACAFFCVVDSFHTVRCMLNAHVCAYWKSHGKIHPRTSIKGGASAL